MDLMSGNVFATPWESAPGWFAGSPQITRSTGPDGAVGWSPAADTGGRPGQPRSSISGDPQVDNGDEPGLPPPPGDMAQYAVPAIIAALVLGVLFFRK